MAKHLDLNDISIYYGDFHAAQNVNPHIPPCPITAFIGLSGCGRSTVLRPLDRMHEVIPGAYVTGGVFLDGESIHGPRIDPVSVHSTTGAMFQRPNPFPAMSIEDNVMAGLKLAGVKNEAHFQEAAEKLLHGANLQDEVKDRLNGPGGDLSGGQQQRLYTARATAVRPEVLLAGEPCSAPDPISTLAIEGLIHELKAEFTIVIAIHNMQQVAHVSGRTAFSSLEATDKPGRLVEVDLTKKIFENPEKKETEDYISGRSG